jgi:hypothetical protein
VFSYRHAFHAGNHADVLKHAILIHTLEYSVIHALIFPCFVRIAVDAGDAAGGTGSDRGRRAGFPYRAGGGR